MPADDIARVLVDIRTDRVNRTPGVSNKLFEPAKAMVMLPQPIVDVSALYEERTTTLMDRDWQPYDEHPSVAPPWERALYCYENRHGNVVLASMHAWEPEPTAEPWWETINDDETDWESLRWRVIVFFWMGGKTRGTRTPSVGPVWMLELAVHDDGRPADIHWSGLAKTLSTEEMQVPQFVVLDALNFLNCRNVTIAEPSRPNHLRKRVAKTGLTINEIHVFPAGKSRAAGVRGEPLGSVHAPVRGHFAHYGDRYGKGKLFGKIEGRFFIPPHVRGSKDIGESVQEFTLRTDARPVE